MSFSERLFNSISSFQEQRSEISELISNDKPKYDDDVMECLQFGICSSRLDKPKEIPYFHF